MSLLYTNLKKTYGNKQSSRYLAIAGIKNDLYLIFQNTDNSKLYISQISKFQEELDLLNRKELKITFPAKKPAAIPIEASIKVSEFNNKIWVTFQFLKGKKIMSAVGNISPDITKWTIISINKINAPFTILPNPQNTKNFISYIGENKILLTKSSNFSEWETSKIPVLAKREEYFDAKQIKQIGVHEINEGFLMAYESNFKNKTDRKLQIGLALFSKQNPYYVIYRDSYPSWEKNIGKEKLNILGSFYDGSHLIVYLVDSKNKLHSLKFRPPFSNVVERASSKPGPKLKRSPENPILLPGDKHWENFSVFNTAALLEEGKVHLLYRAQGLEGLSVIGYAASEDGVHFTERHDKPVFVLQQERKVSTKPIYSSGEGWGGAEDPRVTKIGDTVYMIYVSFNGWEQGRLALSSISYEDFKNKDWNWSTPEFMSVKPTIWGTGNKCGALFPEKINGKYVILHRIWPNISIDYVDDLDFSSEDKWLEEKAKIPPRKGLWDNAKIGAGAPPIKTDKGWLLIYQSVGKETGQYKIGAMLLDLKDPSKVLFRSRHPILEPEEWYETTGIKPGIAYPCGAVVKDGELYVYYGAADNVICVATANLNELLHELMNQPDESSDLVPVKLKSNKEARIKNQAI